MHKYVTPKTAINDAGVSMPRYKCHKEVWAQKIASIWPPSKDGLIQGELIPVDDQYGAILIGLDWFNKFKPEVGGYYVVYADNYISYSPANAFEEGYTKI